MSALKISRSDKVVFASDVYTIVVNKYGMNLYDSDFNKITYVKRNAFDKDLLLKNDLSFYTISSRNQIMLHSSKKGEGDIINLPKDKPLTNDKINTWYDAEVKNRDIYNYIRDKSRVYRVPKTVKLMALHTQLAVGSLAKYMLVCQLHSDVAGSILMTMLELIRCDWAKYSIH